MQTLEHYLSSDFKIQQQEISAIDRTLTDVANLFAACSRSKGWPYSAKLDELQDLTLELKPQSSSGTMAMILSSVGVLIGNCRSSHNYSADITKSTKTRLEGLWKANYDKLKVKLADDDAIKSDTFGPNNILTVSHICELIETQGVTLSDVYIACQSDLNSTVAKAFKSGVAATFAQESGSGKDPAIESEYQENAFIMLRAMRSKHILRKLCKFTESSAPEIKRYWEFFESKLHDHLSFSSIPDSRFDPAELIFCLEGLLLCSREAVDTTLLKRVLEVLSDKQSANSHWRANKPFLTKRTGAIHLPLSVEGANSLMRSIAIMDEHRHFNTYTAMALPLIGRFWTWLRARSVKFEVADESCIGWHSEHVNTPDAIHFWDTAMVAEFMFSYREMLERHMADISLQLSGLSVSRSKKGGKEWKGIADEYEPLLGGDAKEQIYHSAGIDFIEGWKDKKPKNFSILLYGPPGTGKSTFAENVAKSLGFPFITVTVSDFLGAGGANVEARAKAVFKALELQKDCVILFDEIDSFLLDRNSTRYSEQDSLFQFLTPGMLTKINDLRKLKRSIFVIATNYEKRIDSAIKRTGRIDKKYLLGLPNLARRAAILDITTTEMLSELKVNSVLFAFTDLMSAKDGALVSNGSSDEGREIQKEIDSNLVARDPATSVEVYLDQLREGEIFPILELEGLLDLMIEAKIAAVHSVAKNYNPLTKAKVNINLLPHIEDVKSKLVALGFEWPGASDDGSKLND